MPIKQLSQSEASPSPAAPPAWTSRIDILQSLRVHRLLATVIALATMGLGLAYMLSRRASYEAVSVIYVSPNFHPTLATNAEQEYPYDAFVEEQVHTVTSYNVLANAIKSLKPGVWQVPGESLDSAIDRLQDSLAAKRDGQSFQVRISLLGSDPTNLPEIVNAVTESYLAGVKGEEFYGRDERLDSLRQERAGVESDLAAKLKEQTQISQTLGLAVIPTEGGDQIDEQVAKLRGDLVIAHEQRVQAEAALASLENGGKAGSNAALDAAADDIIASDPSLLALKSSLSTKRAVLLDQLAGMTANHPMRKSTEAQLAESEAALQQMMANLRGHAAANLQQKLRTDLKRVSSVEAQLQSDLQKNTHQATHAAPSFQRALVLKSEITALQARYAALDERTRNLELESKSPGSVHMFSAARSASLLPSKNRMILPVMVPIALLLAVITVVLVDLLDRRIHSAADIEQTLGMPPIGMLFDDQDVTMQVFDECTLRLAAGIDQAARTSGVRTIVLTSVNAGAGTTSIVENLGSTLAKLGRRTLTIDATGMTKPVAYVNLNLDQTAHRGVGGFPAVKPDVDIQSTAIITQPFSHKITPLTNFMDQAFKDLTTDYDVVLIDATPLLISAETEYLARFADVTVLIAEAENTTRAQLARATRLLEKLQIPGMAVIVNKMTFRRANQATREDLSAFEARMEKANLRWNASWNRPPAPATRDNHEEAATTSEEKTTVA